jgi:diguanylate cyclase (GGDEF)-like protein
MYVIATSVTCFTRRATNRIVPPSVGPLSRHTRRVSLLDAAARVMTLAQTGRPEQALEEAERALTTFLAAPPSAHAAMWYTVAVAHHVAGDHDAVIAACDRCVGHGLESDDPGWTSNGLSLRAMGLTRQGQMEPALLDLARAEAELARCDDDGLRCWAHTGLGYCYLELRLYELAQPHLERAQELDASPIPLVAAPVIDLMNLVELHARWADELERVKPYDGADEDVVRHRKEAHAYAELALQRATGLDDQPFLATCRAMELYCRPGDTAEASLEELRTAFGSETHTDYQGSRAVAGGALARALWSLGRRDEAMDVARQAADLSGTAGDWQVAASAQWLIVEMEAQAGVPGALAGRSYARLLSRVLWQQRLSTLQGAQAALEVEGLHRDNALARRAASEDPLTGVGNRRALDAALLAVQSDAGAAALASPVSLLVVDLNDFKRINDTYGHVVGDEVLRAVAAALRGVARSRDVVARLGGDEFVVLARGADVAAGRHLSRRVADAIDTLVVGTADGAITLRAAVGVATSSSGHDVGSLLAEADAAMYADKAADR